jgi:hypothetical protein
MNEKMPSPEELKKIQEEHMSDAEKEQSEKREKFLNFREAIRDYKGEYIERTAGEMLEKFHSKIKHITHGGGFGFDPDPSGYHDDGVVFRNMVYHFVSASGVEENDDLNCSLDGLTIKRGMEIDPEFNEFVTNYINKANESDAKNWNEKDELYSQITAEQGGKGYPPKYLLDPNNGRYTQGKYLEKYILGNI